MKIPTVRGIIDRRILANFRIDADCMATALPAPFRPQLHRGWAIGGICLIRLKQVRPNFLPLPWGLQSENAAHRIAVEWDDAGQTKQGVYVPRRDTNSRLNSLAGGTIFPGVQHFAKFTVTETAQQYSVTMNSVDDSARVHVAGSLSNDFPTSSIFETLNEASDFFEQGSLGYSDTKTSGVYDGIELSCIDWKVESLDVDAIESSYFLDSERFPPGSVAFDCALLMRGIDHRWHGRTDLCCSRSV